MPRGIQRNAPVMVWVTPDKNLYTVAITGYSGWKIYQVSPSGVRYLRTLTAFNPPAEWGDRIALKNVNRRVSEFIKEERSSPDRWSRDLKQRDPQQQTHRGYTLRSGRRILGSIKPTETRGVYLWSSNFTKDRGVTEGLDKAIKILLREAGMSLRQFEIDLVDAETGKRRSLN